MIHILGNGGVAWNLTTICKQAFIRKINPEIWKAKLGTLIFKNGFLGRIICTTINSLILGVRFDELGQFLVI